MLDEELIFLINSTQSVTEFTKEERMMASCEKIEKLMNVAKENVPFPRSFKMTAGAQCRALMNQAKSLTYIVDDTDILVHLRKSLGNCVKIIEKLTPKASNGIILKQERSSKLSLRNVPKA